MFRVSRWFFFVQLLMICGWIPLSPSVFLIHYQIHRFGFFVLSKVIIISLYRNHFLPWTSSSTVVTTIGVSKSGDDALKSSLEDLADDAADAAEAGDSGRSSAAELECSAASTSSSKSCGFSCCASTAASSREVSAPEKCKQTILHLLSS